MELNLHGGNPSGRSRSKADFYPTPASVTVSLLDYFSDRLRPGMTIWEPACGEMDMANIMYNRGFNVIATDIHRTQDDYLSTYNNCDAIITNPPFKLSEKFIRKAVEEASFVGMLLKSQYWHAARRVALFKDYPPSYVLPLTWRPDFLFKSRTPGSRAAPTMEVQWCVWDKLAEGTTFDLLIKPKACY